jgi:hypothetical protein
MVKRLRLDVEDASGVEFKNHWSHNCTYGVHGNSFTLFVFTFSVVMKSFVRALVCVFAYRKHLTSLETLQHRKLLSFFFYIYQNF